LPFEYRGVVCTGPGGNQLLWSRGLRAFLPALVAFVATGLSAPLYSSERFDPGLTIWQAVVLWPIGLFVLAAPGWILTEYILHSTLFRIGQIVLVVTGTWAMAATAISEDAQAGLNFLIPSMFGTPATIVLLAVQWLIRRRRPENMDQS
jgi:hypothetical protein